MCALVLSVAYPVRQYLAQRTKIASLVQDNAKRQNDVATLTERRRQLTDPAYIRAQARKRLQYALPGDSTYIVVRAQPAPAKTTVAKKKTGLDRNAAWYSQLADSVRQADR